MFTASCSAQLSSLFRVEKFELSPSSVWTQRTHCRQRLIHTHTHIYTHTFTHTLLMPGGILLLQHCPETHEQVAFNVWAQERAGEPCRGEKEKEKCKQKATGTMFSNTTALKQCPFFACLTPLTNYLLKTHLKVLIKTTNLSINFVHFKISRHAHMGKCLNVTFKYFYIKYFCIKICMQFVFILVVHNFI